MSSFIQPREAKEGDWSCLEPSCGNVNFSKRTKCNRCGTARPRDTEDAVSLGGPPGLFKKGDWACTQCGNVNWARRDKCNICNNFKPAEKVGQEPRMGRGGGHFDLQDPNDRYAHRSDDEEYDDFGRKKKKKQPGDSQNKYLASSSQPAEKSMYRAPRRSHSRSRSRERTTDRRASKRDSRDERPDQRPRYGRSGRDNYR